MCNSLSLHWLFLLVRIKNEPPKAKSDGPILDWAVTGNLDELFLKGNLWQKKQSNLIFHASDALTY